ncbi:septum formation family protein [Nakamurella lactea]|uniref:septum formation family protein n=1 Tax=Nakamurella lactea TaxID=459515 RepID=UPI0003FC9507|nr:septum formation family protein [Nakamurella lactea]
MNTPVIDADEVVTRTSADDRRVYGYGLLAVALIATLCVPGVLGRRANGLAVAAPPAPPPTVGQCLAPIDRPENLVRVISVGTVPCSTAHSAEIVAVLTLDDATPYPESLGAPVMQQAAAACTAAAEEYAGIGSGGSAAAAVAHVRPQIEAVATAPSTNQWNNDQRWLACQVRPAGDTLPVSYLGSVADAAAGPMPAAFSRCAQVIGGEAVPCTEPHYAEQLTDFVDVRDRLNCHREGARLIGAPDPTFHGELSLTGWQESGGRTACWATSTTGQAFVGTLLGWGDRPFPGT